MSGRHAGFSSRSFLPQKAKMSIKPSSLFVVAVLLCSLLDPRDPQQVIVAQGLPPHPGPEPGAVMQEVGVIEEKLQRQADEKPESCSKKQRCVSPSPVSSGSTVPKSSIGDEGKGKLERNKGGSQETGKGEHKSGKALNAANLPPKPTPKPLTKVLLKTF